MIKHQSNATSISNKHNTGTRRLYLNKKAKLTMLCYLLLSTQLIGVVVFNFYPNIWAAIKSFQYYDQIPSHTRWTGLDNYIRVLFEDKTYWQLWGRTIVFAVIKMGVELPLAMMCAVLLSRKIKFSGFFRSMYYLPCVVASAIVGLMLSNMFDYFGIINEWLMRLGWINEPLDWFGNSLLSWIVIIVGYTWSTFGTNVLYFMAALANIDKSVVESAILDGANEMQIFTKIKIPLMGPVLQTIILLAINGTLHISDFILTSTNGAPYGETHTILSYQISQFVPGFADSAVNIGYGCAMAVITSFIMILIALGYSKLSKRLQNVY